MSAENRIVGPGYYPRRPTPYSPIKWHYFDSPGVEIEIGQPILELRDQEDRACGDVHWCGPGEYSRHGSNYRASTVHAFVIREDGIELYRHVLPIEERCTPSTFKVYLDSPIRRFGFVNHSWWHVPMTRGE